MSSANLISTLGGVHQFILALKLEHGVDDVPEIKLNENLEVLKICEEYYSTSFWNHLAIVITHCENTKIARKRREKKGVTDESMKKEIT